MGEARSHRLQIMLSTHERAKLQAGADAAGLTLAAHLRAIANLTTPPPRLAAGLIEREAVAALNRIGANLNQISRIGNATKTLTAPQINALGQLFRDLQSMARKIGASQE